MAGAGGAKPLPVPGPIAGSFYFALVTGAVIFRLAVKKYKLFPTVLVFCLGLQISAIVVVPLVVLIVRWRGGLKGDRPLFSLSWLPHRSTLAGLVALVGLHYGLRENLVELQVWQCAAAVEALAFVILASRLFVAKSAAGISGQKLLLDVLRLACRLAASLWLDRRLPRKSGDDLVRACDGCSLLLACVLLYGVRVHCRATYQAAADSISALPLAAGALVLALPLHANIGHEFVPDVLFTVSLYLEVVAPLPQLQLAAANGGVVDEATSHHLGGLFLGRLLALTFWWYIRTTWARGMGFGGWLILAAGALPLIVLSHYMCYYLRAFFNRSVGSGVPLVCDEG